ncbi:uncharacterized protein LOC111359002 isoform X2 [Spodoptera litura]|uniref:Uncharacterized protein LOC111359002 isoform X2 n=1 Tax=Spodoptera litura TaxID=69820 RepID=A0A9J7J0P9_SPOLT|nr:uncharacterized protein LOC111359002 isoform X2 [Spodoptera litura]
MAKKCFLCGSDGEIIDFNDETFKNCVLKLAFRKKKHFKYNFVELPSASLQFVGYHTTCYKKVTVLNKKYNEEFLNFSVEYTEHNNVSTTEEKSKQLNPSVDSCATVAENETSNVEDLAQTSGDSDTEQSTSTASTSSRIICLFCDHSQKRCGKKLVNLTVPNDDKVPLQIKNIAQNFGDSVILSKLQHQTIAYHLPCYAVYQSKNKRSTEESRILLDFPTSTIASCSFFLYRRDVKNFKINVSKGFEIQN